MRSHPHAGRRRRHQPHRGDGRRHRARRRRRPCCRSPTRAPTWPGRPSGSTTSVRSAARDLHARLRHDELRLGWRLHHGQHAGVLRTMARQVQELGVRPELEVFDTGHLAFVHEMIRDGLLDDPVMIQLCMGIAYGAPDDPEHVHGDGQPAAAPARRSRPSRSAGCSCRSSRWPPSPAATSGSGWRTTCISAAASWRRTPSWSPGPCRSLKAMGVELMSPAEVRDKLQLVKH